MITKKQIKTLNPNTALYRIASYLQSGGTISSLNCGQRVRVSGSALHRRLSDLREKGFEIKSTWHGQGNGRYKLYHA